MGLVTLYNTVSPTDASELGDRLGELLEPVGLVVVQESERGDGLRLATVQRAGEAPLSLGIGLMPIEAGSFQPAPFDKGCDPLLAGGVRTVCKVGAREEAVPKDTALTALAAAAALGGDGRIYDLHAMVAMSSEEGSSLAAGPFDINRFVAYHYLAPPSGEAEHSWLHLHGMAKFFRPDLEAFDVHPDVSHRAVGLLVALAAEMAEGLAPEPGAPRRYGHGAFTVRPSTEARAELQHFSESDFDQEHSGQVLTVADAGRLASLTLLLRGAYEMEPKSRVECEAEQKVWQKRLVGIQQAWERNGEDKVVLRAGLTVGPESTVEHIWVDLDSWEQAILKGRLLNDAFADPSMTRGSEVSFEAGRISGVAVFRGKEVADEHEVLAAVDPAAAQLLDAALEEGPSEPRAVESTSPDGATRARFEDDGRVAYLRLQRADDGRPVGEPLWLYNLLPTPPVMDLRCLDRGLLPLLSEVYASQARPDDAPEARQVDIHWGDGTLLLLLDGEPFAVAETSTGRGWSRFVVVPGRYGRPWMEAEEQVETIRVSRPPTSEEP